MPELLKCTMKRSDGESNDWWASYKPVQHLTCCRLARTVSAIQVSRLGSCVWWLGHNFNGGGGGVAGWGRLRESRESAYGGVVFGGMGIVYILMLILFLSE